MTKLNGDAKVIVERIDNLKEYIKERFEENREEHNDIFKKLSKHGNSISYLKALGVVGASVIGGVVFVLIKTNIG